MGSNPEKFGKASVKLNINLKQILELIKQFNDTQKVALLNALFNELREKKLIDNSSVGMDIDFDSIIKGWGFDDSEEVEMTDEEFLQALEEMS